MGKINQAILILAITNSFLLYSTSASASHIGTAEITWQCVGQDSFIINLDFYRDCAGSPPSSGIIPFKCKSSGATITSILISKPIGVEITPICRDTCSKCTDPHCAFPYGVQKYVYSTGIVNLQSAGSCCEIVASFQGCCRSGTITTGLGNKSFYTEAILNRCVTPCNNSPTFANPPIAIICVGHDFFNNPGVTNIDLDSIGSIADSLSYSWTSPLGNNATPLSYSSPYSYENPIWFWGLPFENLPFPRGFHLDPLTGNIMFRPMKLENTVMAIEIKEFRNRIHIGTVRREMQLIVLNCPNNHPPVLGGPYFKEVCAGDTVTFTISSNDYDPNDSLQISLNESITWATWTDNNDSTKHPTAILILKTSEKQASSIPYTFYVTIKDNACPVNGSTTRAYRLLVKPIPKAGIIKVDTGCYDYWFFAQHIVGAGPHYLWECNGSLEYFYEIDDTIHHKFSNPGKFPFTMTMTAQQCSRKYYDTILVDTILSGNLPQDTGFQCLPGVILPITVNYFNNKGPVSFRWSTSIRDTLQTNLVEINSDTAVHVIINDTIGCEVKDTMQILSKLFPEVELGPDTHYCQGNSVVIKPIKFYGDSILWSSGETTSNIIINQEGLYKIFVSNICGNDSDSIYVKATQLPVIVIDTIPKQCINNQDLHLNDFVKPIGGHWSCPGSGMIQPDVIDPYTAGVGNFWAYYIFTDSTSLCSNMGSALITIVPLPDTSISIHADTLEAISGMMKYQWFKDGDTIIGETSNSYIASEDGSYNVVIIDSNGCQASSSVYVRTGIQNENPNTFIKIYPNPNFGIVTIEFVTQIRGEVYFKLINSLGVELELFNVQANNSHVKRYLDLNGYPKGIYFLEVTNSSDIKLFKKIILN